MQPALLMQNHFFPEKGNKEYQVIPWFHFLKKGLQIKVAGSGAGITKRLTILQFFPQLDDLILPGASALRLCRGHLNSRQLITKPLAVWLA